MSLSRPDEDFPCIPPTFPPPYPAHATLIEFELFSAFFLLCIPFFSSLFLSPSPCLPFVHMFSAFLAFKCFAFKSFFLPLSLPLPRCG